jgi:hypothetical protein
VRPRLIVYAWIPSEIWLWRGSLDAILSVFSLLLAVKMLTGFIQIRRNVTDGWIAFGDLRTFRKAA